MRSIAAVREAPPALSRMSSKRPCGSVMPVAISAAPSPSRTRPRSWLPTTRGHARAGAEGELHREIADPAGGTGDQHALAQQGRAVTERA
jgi:hypothetical protein